MLVNLIMTALSDLRILYIASEVDPFLKVSEVSKIVRKLLIDSLGSLVAQNCRKSTELETILFLYP